MPKERVKVREARGEFQTRFWAFFPSRRARAIWSDCTPRCCDGAEAKPDPIVEGRDDIPEVDFYLVRVSSGSHVKKIGVQAPEETSAS
jgi:hypothetical protein